MSKSPRRWTAILKISVLAILLLQNTNYLGKENDYVPIIKTNLCSHEVRKGDRFSTQLPVVISIIHVREMRMFFLTISR
jgi:hypothetical protein